MTITPASIRNRNPGAQEPGPSSKKFGSSAHEVLRWTYKGKPAVNKIATFPTSQHGAAAMLDLLNRKYTGKTVEKAISTWCGGYYAEAYASALQANGGVKPSDPLTKDLLKNPAFAVPLCKAMAKVEAGKDYPMTDEEWQEAHAMAFGAGVAPEFSPSNDVPSPGPTARMVAELKEAAKIAIPAVTVTGGATVATQTAPVKMAIPSIPAPPDVSQFSGWQTAMDTVAGFGKYLAANPIMAVIAAAVCLAVFVIPKLRGEA